MIIQKPRVRGGRDQTLSQRLLTSMCSLSDMAIGEASVQMSEVSSHSWHNGAVGELEQGAPSIASISFHLGTSVFDGIMAYWNRDHYHVYEAERHLIRFKNGAARMGLNFPWGVDDLMKGLDDLLSLEPKRTQYIRPIAYRRAPELWVTGAEGRPVDVSIFTVRTDNVRNLNKLITCQSSPVERISSASIPGQVKVSGSYVNSFHARRTAELAGFDDGVMFDRNGRIAEASAANFFAIIEDRLVTPPLNPDVFPGVTRFSLINIARQLGIDVEERDLYGSDTIKFDGAFLCSTLMEIRGISIFQDIPLGTAENRMYKRLVVQFRSTTHT
jgi:branched-chain amino acid aminotransferase